MQEVTETFGPVTVKDLERYLVKERRLDPALLTNFGIEYLQPAQGCELAIAFPYKVNGKTVAHKFRTLGKRFSSTPGVSRGLFNGDVMVGLGEKDTLYVTEGEIDCLSLIYAGFANTVSIPNGWGKQNQDCSFFDEYEEELKRVGKIVVAGDNDGAGSGLPKAVANYVQVLKRAVRKGANVQYCEWPEDCKDANDVLVKYGPEQLGQSINSAQAIDPPSGRIFQFDSLPPRPARRVLRPGGWANKVMALELGAMSVLTGYPGSGKSQFAVWAAHKVAVKENIRVGLINLETHPYRIRDQLCRYISKKPFDELSGEQLGDAYLKLEKHYRVFERSLNDEQPFDLDIVEEFVATLSAREGCKLVIIDPWNEIEHNFGGMTETDYTNRGLPRLRQLVASLGIHLMVVAHPKKPATETNRAPTGYDIAGSAAWFNKADLGLSVYWNGAPASGEERLYVKNWKCREVELYGITKNVEVNMAFDQRSAEYYEI